MNLNGNGRVALVTGGGRGIGAAIATGLAQDGHTVVIADMRRAEAEETAAAITEAGGTARAFEVDVVILNQSRTSAQVRVSLLRRVRLVWSRRRHSRRSSCRISLYSNMQCLFRIMQYSCDSTCSIAYSTAWTRFP